MRAARNSDRTPRSQSHVASRITMRAWPVARSIFDAPLVREANERTTSWISPVGRPRARAVRAKCSFIQCPTCCPLVRFSHIRSIEDAARDGPCAHGKMQSCWLDKIRGDLGPVRMVFVGLQPTVIASRASPPLLEQSSSRFKESWTRVARQYGIHCLYIIAARTNAS